MRIKSNRKKNLKKDEIVKKKSILKTIWNKQTSIKRIKTKLKKKDNEIENKSQFGKLFQLKQIVIKSKMTKFEQK